MGRHRLRFVRGTSTLELQAIGHSLFIDGSEGPSTLNYFDDSAAAEAATEWVRLRLAEGWQEVVEPPPEGATRVRAPPRKPRVGSQSGLKKALLEQLRPGMTPSALRLFKEMLVYPHVVWADGTCSVVPPGSQRVPRHQKTKIGGSKSAGLLLRPFLGDSRRPVGVPSASCSGISCGESGRTGQLNLHDGTQGTLHTVGEDALSEEVCGFSWAEVRCAPIDVNLESFYLIHPAAGRLCFYDGEGVLSTSGIDDPVEAYLRELFYRLILPGATHRSKW